MLQDYNFAIIKYICVAWLVLMAIVSGFLIVEYRFFKQQSSELEQLKSDYSQYIESLKRIVSNQESNFEPKFLVVNREPKYLKESALSFARMHNMEWALQKMYESDIWVGYTRPERSTKISRNNIRVRTAPYENVWKKLQCEPIFIWPIERSQFWLSSPFGPRKKPNGSWELHTGIDMAAQRGTPIKAGQSGIVIQASYSSGYGNTVVLDHGQITNDKRKFKTRYAHMDTISVKVGEKINQGQIIGTVGATGCVRKSKNGKDASHLHFEVYVLDKQVNPFYFLA